MQTIKTFTAGDHRWINRPAVVEQQADRLVVTTDANTDFWLKNLLWLFRGTPATPAATRSTAILRCR